MITVLIPVYKQTEFFLAHFKHNLPFFSHCEIIIVNDDPTTDLSPYLQNIENLTLIQNKHNLGFAGAVNVGIRKAQGTRLVLLNSDVKLKDASFKKAEKTFDHPKLFAVSFAQEERNGTIVGANRWYWHDGFFQHEGTITKKRNINAWAEGGAAMFDLQKLRNLGGFDERFSPFYWEDIDLSYRAWKAGYTIVFDPTIVVIHAHESTIKTYFANKMKTVAYRNQLLFIWKNIYDPTLRIKHIAGATKFFMRAMFRGDWSFIKGFFSAVLKHITTKKETVSYAKTDKEVLQLFAK
ncbi:glycosyltransferase family 2 protein [Candidatus Woesebacteria bacterium]|nr:glycosyltransferase family 2 protein [Candidatus Woesebacteria bacterium]